MTEKRDGIYNLLPKSIEGIGEISVQESGEVMLRIGSSYVFNYLRSEDEADLFIKVFSGSRYDIFPIIVPAELSDETLERLRSECTYELFGKNEPKIYQFVAQLSGAYLWYAPLKKEYYVSHIVYEGYSHDGSEDYYSVSWISYEYLKANPNKKYYTSYSGTNSYAGILNELEKMIENAII